MMSGKRKFLICIFSLPFLFACSEGDKVPTPQDVDYQVEYYPVAHRRHPAQAPYSRVMWSHLPTPPPKEAAVSESTPYLWPEMKVELADSTLAESLEALCSAIGYRAKYSRSIANRSVSIHMTATVDKILAEIGRQARVTSILKQKSRILEVKNR